MTKKTLVFGTSLKESRYSNRAVQKLRAKHIPVVAYGLKRGTVVDVEVDTELKNYKDIHTVTLYLNPKRQSQYYNYIIKLAPKRVIFNPGTENSNFVGLLKKKGIQSEVACTLVLLSINQY